MDKFRKGQTVLSTDEAQRAGLFKGRYVVGTVTATPRPSNHRTVQVRVKETKRSSAVRSDSLRPSGADARFYYSAFPFGCF